MKPTEEIRAKLGELGISWFAIADTATEYAQEGIVYRAYEVCGGLQVAIVTPVTVEQAISATVGAGTCELINAADDLGEGTSSCTCFKCGYTALDDWWDEFKYCPNCGRRIEMSK